MTTATKMIQPGYKQTEVGVIPEDWEVIELKDAVDFLDGQRRPIKNSERAKMRGQYPYYGASGIIDYVNDFLFDDELILLGEDGENILSRNLPLAFVVKGKVWVNNHAHVLKSKEAFDTYFLAEKLESLNYENHNTGTAQPKLNKKNCSKIRLSLPPTKSEQTAIATALTDMDALIAAQEQLIAKKRAIKQGAMQELLEAKEGWEEKRLGEIAQFRRGSFPQPYGLPEWYDEDSGTPFVQVYDVDDNMKLKPTTKQKISDLAKDKSVFVEKGNIILTIQGSIGRIAITQYDSYVDRTLLIFTSYKVPIHKVFFAYVIQEKFRIEKENAPGGTIKTITKEVLSKFDISLPHITEQTRIAQILSDMDAEIEQLGVELAKLHGVKKGMMEGLLTGAKRLNH